MFDLHLGTPEQWTFNQADMIFYYMVEDRCRARDYGVASPIEVVPNGVDTERVTPEGPTSELIEHDGLVAIFVGRLVDGKRPQDAITAVRRAQREQSDLKLYLCGAGPLREEREDQAGEGTEFLGHVPSDEMPAIYRSANVMVVPSRAEGVPRTVLEAIAARVYTVTTALPQYEKIVEEEYGTTVPVEDPTAMGRQIAAFLDSSGGIEPGAGGSEYSWQRTLKEPTATLRRIT